MSVTVVQSHRLAVARVAVANETWRAVTLVFLTPDGNYADTRELQPDEARSVAAALLHHAAEAERVA